MSTRKDFLAAGSVFALTPALADAAAPATPAMPDLTFNFNPVHFAAIMVKSAKHRQCFGITKIADGAPLEAMQNSIRAYNDFLKEGPGAMYALGVLYHGASIGFAMNDTIWNEYFIPLLAYAPAFIRQDVGTPKRGGGNPFKSAFQGLVADGSAFLVCHNAIAGFADMMAGALKTSPQKAHDALIAGIMPGALVVPAGVMAINAAQEAKFTYIAT